MRWRSGRSSTGPGIVARTGRSLARPNYRRFIGGHAISMIGTWMQRVAQDWLVLELTHSAFAIGVTMALQFLPILVFGLWGGVLVDRFDRRALLLLTQAMSAVLATILATLTLLDRVNLATVFVMATLLGFVTVIDSPARQAFLADLVTADDYVNAQALNSTIHNAGRLVGPALAGLIIAAGGPGTAFAVNAVSFAAVLVGLVRIDPAQLQPRHRIPRAKGQILEGLRYAGRHRELRACLILVAIIGVFGQNFRVVLPITATEVLHGDAATYGYLTAALGLGAVVGAVGAASMHTVSGRSLLLWTLGFASVNLATALLSGMLLLLSAMVALGVGNILFNTLARSLLQLRSERAMHGRVMSLHSLLFLGSTPLGGPLSGWVCTVAGSRWAFAMAAVTAFTAAACTSRDLLAAGSGVVEPVAAEPV